MMRRLVIGWAFLFATGIPLNDAAQFGERVRGHVVFRHGRLPSRVKSTRAVRARETTLPSIRNGSIRILHSSGRRPLREGRCVSSGCRASGLPYSPGNRLSSFHAAALQSPRRAARSMTSSHTSAAAASASQHDRSNRSSREAASGELPTIPTAFNDDTTASYISDCFAGLSKW